MTTPTNPSPENKMAPTPETDAELEDARNVALEFECRNPRPKKDENILVVPADFARKLERERNELREQLEHALNPIHTCGDHCQRPACVIRRERDQLLAKTHRLEKEIEKLTLIIALGSEY